MASLTQRTGVLGRRLAAHLLKRCTYHVTPARIEAFAALEPDAAVDALFNNTALAFPDGPPDAATGQPLFSLTNHDNEPGLSTPSFQRMRATVLWRIYECIADTSIKWKLINWMSSIYSVYHSGSPYNYAHWRLLEKMALGTYGPAPGTPVNLKTLASKMTFDNQMLIYLNNNQNNKLNGSGVGPNENYAREFLELFTILKGEAIAVGNYTNYTEADISTAARVLTGIKNNKTNIDPDTGIIRGNPNFNQHDIGQNYPAGQTEKTFSSAFQNRVIAHASNSAGVYTEVDQFVDMIFDQLATARAYVTKLYNYFVNDKITTEVENDIIEPLAITLNNNGYQHIPVLKQLLKSVHFYDEDDVEPGDEIIGAKVKSPYELFFTTANLLETTNRDAGDLQKSFQDNYYRLAVLHFANIGLDLRGPITVEGFAGFYDKPGYSRNWFSANFVYDRFTTGVSFKRGFVRNTGTYFPYKADLMNWVNTNIDVPGGPGASPFTPIGAADAFKLVDDTLTYLLPEMPTGERLEYFQNQLLGGLSPINWYFSWGAYLTSNDETEVLVGIERLYDAVLSSPEFQTL